MEMSAQAQRSPFLHGTRITIKPFFGTFTFRRSPQLFPWCNECNGIRMPSLVAARADYSRRRPRKNLVSRGKGPARKGFMPRTRVGTSTQKRDRIDNVQKEGADSSSSSELTDLDNKVSEMKANDSEEQRSELHETSHLSSEVMPRMEVGTSSQKKRQSEDVGNKDFDPSNSDDYSLENELIKGRGNISDEQRSEGVPKTIFLDTQLKMMTNLLEKVEEHRVDIDGDRNELGKQNIHEKSKIDKGPEFISDLTKGSVAEIEGKTDLEVTEGLGKIETVVAKELDEEELLLKRKQEMEALARKQLKMTTNLLEKVEEHRVDIDGDRNELGKQNIHEKSKIDKGTEFISDLTKGSVAEIEGKTDLEVTEGLGKVETVVAKELDEEELLLKRKQEMEALARKQFIEDLAEENLSKGIKVFVFPQVARPDQDIEVFMNKNISSLKNEHDVLIMGAFNDWRWKFFQKKLHKTDLKNDWWSCEVNIPKEAYKMDFVFFNGGDVYENNDSKDFFVPVEGGMDMLAFEDFLLEEKRRELEKLAAEQAERERQAEEQRRKEVERAASEADRAQAKVETERRREIIHQLMKKVSTSVDNVWYIEPSESKADNLIRLYYNRSSGPLAHTNEMWIHGGYNSWRDGLSIVGRLEHSEKKAGDWWHVDVVVPDRALILDWVFADGPPGNAKLYDNNKYQDFHAIVPKCIPEEMYWVEEEHQIYRKLQEERRRREEAIRAKAEKTARMKAETREKTTKMFLLSQKHILYTEPLDVQAGSAVTVFYNPTSTVLSGKPEVWFRCSFNHWTHRHGPLPPQKMVPVENSSHLKVTVKVPLDAYMLDFVFSEKEDGGIYDNKNGMDYHIPVIGGVSKAPPMHIVHVTVEMAPIAKVGGMGDVVTSLSRAVQDLGHNVDIIIPKYDCMNLSNVKDFQFNRSYSWGGTEIKVWYGKVEGLSVYFLEPQNGMVSAGCIYGCRNDGERFGFFCHAALEFLLQSGSHPDILHCHDWTSAPVAWLFKDHYMHYGLTNARVIFTIHNLEFGAGNIGKAMTYCDKATTVSPNYAREVAGNPTISPHLYKFRGILNGIDPDIWDPYNDKFIPMHYTTENVVEGKRVAKEALQKRIGMSTSDRPLVGIITRLTHQKGIHLIKHAIWRTLERNGQVVLLGSAPDPRIQNDFVNLANQLQSSHNDRARLCLTYDEPLSHLIYAGSDFILVPSIFEPCGLTQLIAMRYGSIPVVRKTGGLYDTVFDVYHDKDRAQAQGLEPNGFSFDGADSSGVDYALDRAISAWYDGREWFSSLCARVMEQDWSWNRPSLDYMELYYAARK